MQWVALDGKSFITAAQAERKKDYQCPECHLTIRLRAGPHRQSHFYHLRSSATCPQHQKTAEHLQTQHTLAALGAADDARIEAPFPTIGRIADVAFFRLRTVVEIQVSPLSLEEAQARTRDYLSLGWQIVWILHEQTFNRKRLAPAERHLRTYTTCYFTNISPQGQGIFYDQFEAWQHYERIAKGPALPVAPHRLFPMHQAPSLRWGTPCTIAQRRKRWSSFAEGDLVDRWRHSPEAFGHELLSLEKKYQKQLSFFASAFAWYTRVVRNCCKRST